MSESFSESASEPLWKSRGAAAPGLDGGWTPAAATYPPVVVWPPRPLAALRWLPNLVVPFNGLYVALAVAVWVWATPSTEQMASLRPGWVLLVLGRNLVIVGLCFGLAHWWLYQRRAQSGRFKFNARWPAASRRGRTLGNQHRENVLWTMASGVPIWTAWEVVTLWLYASGQVGWLKWSENPAWFIGLFLLIVLFREIHFYVTHRLIHWRPLYRTVHSLHHRNVNPSPWSGLSMHPLEHLLYFSAIAFHLVVASHPVHVLFTGLHLALAPLPGHSGFERFELGGDGSAKTIATGGYAHYLHHKLFEVNYADGVIPLDRWFGSFHDGSPEADRLLRQRRKTRPA